MTEQNWIEHADVLIPAIQYAIETLLWVIAGSVTALCAVIGWVGKQFIKKFNAMDGKLDTMHHIMLACEGCSKAAEAYGRRKTDLIDEGSL
jgi:hypothetical protein